MEVGGSPLLQQRGATLQRCGEEIDFLIMRFSAGFERSRAKAHPLRNEWLFRWTEVQLPLLKQGAPTRRFGVDDIGALAPSTVKSAGAKSPLFFVPLRHD